MNCMMIILRHIISIARAYGGVAILVMSMFVCAWFGASAHWEPASLPPSLPPSSSPLPTIADIQRRIGANPDGKLGPETQRKWDRAICDQFAAESFRKSMPQKIESSETNE